MFSNYNYAVFFSHQNDKESLKINSQSQSGLKKPRNSSRPALLDTTFLSITTFQSVYSPLTLRKTFWRLRLEEILYTQQHAQAATSSLFQCLCLFSGERQSPQNVPVTFQSFLFIDIQYQFTLHKQVGPAQTSAHSEQSIKAVD